MLLSKFLKRGRRYRGSVDLSTLLCTLRQIGDSEKRAREGICMVSPPGPAARYVAQQAFEGCCAAVRPANSVRLGNAAAQRSSSWCRGPRAKCATQRPRRCANAKVRDDSGETRTSTNKTTKKAYPTTPVARQKRHCGSAGLVPCASTRLSTRR
jgi:hypothetical protein